MNQLCKVCGEPAAGFHFGAFTCEGCKSFFGRTYNNISAIAGCKNSGDCVINKKNRTACKACRLRKCLLVGMSKSGSRYGRRSNWFKIHCLLQETQQTQTITGSSGASNFDQLARLHQMQARQTYQDKTNPCIKTASMSPTQGTELSAAALVAAATNSHRHNSNIITTPAQQQQMHYIAAACASVAAVAYKTDSRLSDDTPSDSGASSASDDADADGCIKRSRNKSSSLFPRQVASDATIIQDDDEHKLRRKQFLKIIRSRSEPLRNHPFAPFDIAISHIHPQPSVTIHPSHILPATAVALKDQIKHVCKSSISTTTVPEMQDEPIDLSLKSRLLSSSLHTSHRYMLSSPAAQSSDGEEGEKDPSTNHQLLLNVIQKPAPLDLTLVGTQPLTGMEC